MYSVRIDKDGDGYVFKVQPCEGILEIVGLDSTPGIIAMVHANDPGHACWRAWDMAEHMNDEQPGQLDSPFHRFLAELSRKTEP
jgi:hypothetical protein